jgi:hypothetical protein
MRWILTEIYSDRLPIPIAKFISQEVYKNRLLEDTEHEVKTPTEAMLFVDVHKGEELREEKGTSFMVMFIGYTGVASSLNETLIRAARGK